jgi:hypothetical protein
MTERKQYEAVLLKEESNYDLSSEFAETFEGLDISVGPKTITEEMPSIVGIIDNAYLSDEGITADVTVFDSEVIGLLNNSEAVICPTITRELGESKKLNAIDVFVTLFPGEDVGPVREKE